MLWAMASLGMLVHSPGSTPAREDILKSDLAPSRDLLPTSAALPRVPSNPELSAIFYSFSRS